MNSKELNAHIKEMYDLKIVNCPNCHILNIHSYKIETGPYRTCVSCGHTDFTEEFTDFFT